MKRLRTVSSECPDTFNLWPRDRHNIGIWDLLTNGVNSSLVLRKSAGGEVTYDLVDAIVCPLCGREDLVGIEKCPACGEILE